MKSRLYILFLLFIFCSCAGSKQGSVPTDTRYQRKPIQEVSDNDLKVEGEQIDAKIQQLVGKQNESIEKFSKILKGNSDYAPAHYELGRIYLGLGWVDSALYHTKKALSIDPNNYWYERQLAQAYVKAGDGKNLIATWEDIVKRHPDSPDNFYDLSNAYLMTDNVPSAIEALDRVEKRFGLSEPVLLQKQKLYEAIGKPDKARKELEKLAEAVPSDPSYNAILAEGYMKEKNYSKALQYYKRILESHPDNEDIHISLAVCYMTMGQWDKSYNHLRLGVMHPNIDCQHKLTYIVTFLREKSFFVAYGRSCFLLADSLVSQCPEVGPHNQLYGQLLAAQERYAEASVQFARQIEQDMSQYETWEALLLCESMVDDASEQLMEHAQRASELFPLHTRPYLILSQGYLKKGDCEKARQYIKKCLTVAPKDPLVQQLNQTIEETCK